ncbi:hypothetical protein ACFPM7_02395 [Actinokineospora guangxiensis]|uniref:Uncharacterized protein n=1 Tax=Actinokineospora guangxiensis TaxID=1490288 RepID=A0ABW0EEP4_9PSEU
MSRPLVLIAAAALLAAAGLVSFLVLLLGPAMGGSPVTGTVLFTLVVVLAAAGAVVLAVRGARALWGCSVLILGALLATGVLLAFVSRS